MKNRNRVLKRVLACIMVVLMAVAAVPMSGFVGLELPKWSEVFTTRANALSTTGNLGDNVTYTYDSPTETLTISGSGKMNGYWYNSSPFFDFSIKKVIIKNGVTNIGDRVFYGCTNLASVTIGNDVTSIGDEAFSWCTGLISITIPDSVTSIGECAFTGCAGLTSVTLGNGISSIGNYLFEDCTSLTSITIPDRVTSIGDLAFYGCTGLTKINWYAENITNYGSCVFDKIGTAGDGVDIVFGDNVKIIPDYAFYTRDSSNRPKINSITIGNSVTSIGRNAFYGCKGSTSVTIPDSVTSIGYSAFGDCTGLTSITIGTSVVNIGSNAFANCAGLTKINWNAENVTDYGSGVFEKSGTAREGIDVVFGDNVKKIPNYAFYSSVYYYRPNIKFATIGNSVTSIGAFAFYGCTGLESITIPDSVTSIGERAFSNCKRLTSVTIGSGLTSVAPDTFYSSIELISISADKNNPEYSSKDGVLFNKEQTKLVAYPAGRTESEYIIPSSVTDIGDYAFSCCAGLTSVTIGNGVTRIGDYAFSPCAGLTSVTIGNRVTSIGFGAFGGCTGLTSVTIPNSVTSIGNSAFKNCTGLTSITIPDSVTSIGDYTFCNCTGLTSITIPDSVTRIGDYAFCYCKILNDVYYAGTSDQWNAISMGQNNEGLINAMIHIHTHHYLAEIIKAATCTADGVTTYTCNCGDSYTEAIPSLDHKNAVNKAAVASTCVKAGYTAGKYCPDCGKWISGHQIVPATSKHTYKATTTKATTAKDGKIVTACTVCGFVSKTTPIYKASSIKLSATAYTYNAKVQRPTVTVKNSKGTTLKNGTDYTVTYSSGCKNPGKYAVKVTFKGNYTGSQTLYFTILPGITSSIATATNSAAIKLVWKAVPGATGYRVFQHDTKTKKYVTVKTLTGISCTVSKLNSGTSYKFAVKAYTTVNGTVYWASGYKKVTATTNPGTPTLSVAAGAKKAVLKWSKRAEATGYVVYMATSKTGKYSRIAALKGNSAVSYTKTGLTTGKTYYFKVAAYTTSGGSNIYSAFSAVKGIKVK